MHDTAVGKVQQAKLLKNAEPENFSNISEIYDKFVQMDDSSAKLLARPRLDSYSVKAISLILLYFNRNGSPR